MRAGGISAPQKKPSQQRTARRLRVRSATSDWRVLLPTSGRRNKRASLRGRSFERLERQREFKRLKEASKLRANAAGALDQLLRSTLVPLSAEMFKPVKSLGKGAFGSVQLMTYIPTGKNFAVKRLSKEADETDDTESDEESMGGANLGSFLMEMLALRRLKKVCDDRNVRSFVLCYSGFFEDAENWYLVTEFLPNMIPLEDLLYRSKPLTLELRKTIIHNLIAGLKQIHGAYVAHRDIKPSNILVDPATGDIKFIDFGMACVGEGCFGLPVWGTENYMPPEATVLKEEQRNLRAFQDFDIWALGLVIADVFDHNTFDSVEEPSEFLYSVDKDHLKRINKLLPHSIRTFLNPDPHKRHLALS
jgi:serine/threonine protein kinase